MQPIQSIAIPQPCHENWNQMTPVDQGRHCDSCNKNVIDFTRMTNKEIINYFTMRDNVCGRFGGNQLEAVNNYLALGERSFFSWKKLALAAALTSLFATAKAQVPASATKTAIHHTKQKYERLPMIEALPGPLGKIISRADSLPPLDTNKALNSANKVLYGRMGGVTVGQKVTFCKSFWYKLKRAF